MAYQHYATERGHIASGRVPLDAIDPDLVGELQVRVLCERFRQVHSLAPDALNGTFLRNLKWLSAAQEYESAVNALSVSKPHELTTDAQYLRHLQQLTTWRVCNEVPVREVVATNRYFAVLKNAKAARSIVDCARFSEKLREVSDIASVRLPTIPELLKRLHREIARANPQKYGILLSDLRHFFHQIPLDESVKKYFAVKIRQAAFIWNALPMGHTVSPLVAQTISYAILLMCGFSAEGGMERIPHFGTRAGGVAAVWYDNLIAAGTISAMQDTKNRWEQQCGAVHAVLKYSNLFRGKALGRDGDDEEDGVEVHPIVLGLRLACHAGQLSFRHKQANVVEWETRTRILENKDEVTLRELARLLGVVMFDAYVATASDITCDALPTFVAVGKRIGRMSFQRTWDSIARYPQWAEDRQLLCGRIREIAVNPWRVVESTPDPEYFLCTDASTGFWGAIWMPSKAVHKLQPCGGRWRSVSQRLHISAKEALAVLLALKNAPEAVRGHAVRVAIDAQAIVYALRRRVSGSATIQQILDRIFTLARSLELKLQFLWIPGSDNAADIITRPEYWGSELIRQIDWTSENATTRLRKTVACLQTETTSIGDCEERKPEEIVERFCSDENDADGVEGFQVLFEEGITPELLTPASSEGQG